MKRVLSLVLAVSMVLSLFTFSFAGSNLTDIGGTEYEAAVDALVELGVVAGYPDGTYLPNKAVSRAEMAKLLVVASGLESAAEVSEGSTKFNDVNGGWESGYVNVASEYGFIAGYPDGSFRPNAQVTYSEAVTMALRVLGYRTVIESKGTWPTNYISKASDLKLLEDITMDKYTDGATRGNVALLIWNMLRTKMWSVDSENESNGLTYRANHLMLNVKFPDYSYSKAEFEGYTLDADGEVIVTLNDNYDAKVEGSLDASNYEYLANDFYTFVPGTEVEVLVNEEDGTLLTMVATDRDTLKEGLKADFDEDYEALRGATYDYVYAMIKRKDVATDSGEHLATALKVESEYIYEAKYNEKNVKLNTTTYSDKNFDEAIVLIDGERASLRDVEVGMVLSRVAVNGEDMDDAMLFIVSEETTNGKFTKYVEKDYKNGSKYEVLTVGGEEYLNAAATYVEDPEDDKEKENKLLSSASESLRKDMKNEEVVVYLDFLGRVTRLDFDGNIGDETSSEVAFYAVTANVEKVSSRNYTIGLANENGEDEYAFEKGSAIATELYADDEDMVGGYVAVTFNDDEEITDIELVARATSGDPKVTKETEFIYDENEAKGYYTLVDLGNTGDFDDDEEAVVNNAGASYLVDDDTVLVTVVFDDNGTTTKTSDDEYSVVFAQGVDAVANVKEERVLVIFDAAEKITYAKYVVRFDDTTNRDEVLTGKVESAKLNKLGEYTLTIDDEEYIYRVADNTLGADIVKYEDGVIVFTLKENEKDGETYVEFISGLKVSEVIPSAVANMTDYVDAVSNKVVSFEKSGDLNVTADAFQDVYEDHVFVLVSVNSDTSIDREDVVTGVEAAVKGSGITAADFAEYDRVIITEDAYFIIRGLDEKGVKEVSKDALDFEYEDDYEYAGEFTITDDEVKLEAEDLDADKNGVSVFSADTARFLGGLYRKSGVETISYKGVEYTWVTEGEGITELKGSNFRDAEGTTLVSVMRTAHKAGTTEFELTLDGEIVLNYVVAEA